MICGIGLNIVSVPVFESSSVMGIRSVKPTMAMLRRIKTSESAMICGMSLNIVYVPVFESSACESSDLPRRDDAIQQQQFHPGS